MADYSEVIGQAGQTAAAAEAARQAAQAAALAANQVTSNLKDNINQYNNVLATSTDPDTISAAQELLARTQTQYDAAWAGRLQLTGAFFM